MPYFNKYPISKNFDFLEKVNYQNGIFSDSQKQIKVEVYGNDTIGLKVNYAKKPLPNHEFFQPNFGLEKDKQVFEFKDGVEFRIGDLDFVFDKNNFNLKILEGDKTILKSRQEFVGLNGKQTIFQFHKSKSQPFWGFGSKTGSLNKENQINKMWNVDVIADHPHSFAGDDYDPGYVSIPFFITKIEGRFFGFYLHNSGQTFFNNGVDTNITKLADGDEVKPKFYFGSYTGESQLFIFCGDSFKQIVRSFGKFSGRADLPPLWSLGKHQCKFSYMNKQEIKDVVNGYRKNKIPLDTLWMDIDYMDNFKSFSWDEKNYGSKKDMASWLKTKNVKLVTIIDPGLKEEAGYFAFDEANDQELLCKTWNGKNFVGHVWPGDTVFPDYSLPETRKWWSQKIKNYTSDEVDGIWIDMNDPATGSADPESMLFQHGTVEHDYYRNQYANLMAEGTKNGLLQNEPNQRPFVLTRSASTGIQNYAAVWTGDNASNWDHLKMSIPQSVNLSISGVAFNGPDVGGFMDVPSEELMVRWYQAGFLFPFFRNHNTKHSFGNPEKEEFYQEPYQFSEKAMQNMRSFINLRYQLMPYIYNLFYKHSQSFDPILRPVFYENDEEAFYSSGDQFLVGDSILQAPIIKPEKKRKIILPKGDWYDLTAQKWLKGGQEFKREVNLYDTCIFIKDKSIIPTIKNQGFESTKDLDFKEIELWVFNKNNQDISAKYYEDDGKSFDYKKGKYNLYNLKIEKDKLKVETLKKGFERETSFSVKRY